MAFLLVPRKDEIGETVILTRVENLHKLGMFYMDKLDYLKSLEYFSHANEITQGHFPPESSIYQTSLYNLALSERRSGKFVSAVENFQELYDIRCQHLGPLDRVTILAQINLATARVYCGNLEEAEQHYREILDKRIQTLGDAHLDSIVSRQHLAGFLVRETGATDEAKELLLETMDIFQNQFKGEHPRKQVSLIELSLAFIESKEFHLAEASLLQLLVMDKEKPMGFTRLVQLKSLLATAYREMFLYEEALVYNEEVINACRDAYGIRHLQTAAAYFDVGLTYAAAGDRSMATQSFAQAKNSSYMLLGEAHPWYIQMKQALESVSGVGGYSVQNFND